jgi:putative ABC transport system permease protein
MSAFRQIRSRLRHLVFRRRTEAEMADEMRFHLEQRAAHYVEEGMSDTDARQAALRRFGNLSSIQERSRDLRGWGSVERLVKDLRLALRELTRTPGFALLAVVTLGVGIGANTSMFNGLRTIMLRPLPYSDLARLDRIYRATDQNPKGGSSPADFLDLRQGADAYGEVSAYVLGNASLSEPGHPAEMVADALVTANFFALLGVEPQLGRAFRAGEDTPGRDKVVILSPRTWRNRFEGRRDVIGRTIRVDGEPHQVIGVLPESFNDWRHLGGVDLFRPLAFDEKRAADRSTVSLRVIGRRSLARTPAEADASIVSFGARLTAEFPEVESGSAWRTVSLENSLRGKDELLKLGMLIGLSGFVLLIACSNLANFLLARTMTRAREFALRAAIGASRTQLLRPLIAESLLLAFAGGVCAMFVAQWVGHYLAVRSTGDNGERVVFTLDWTVFGWAVAASFFTAVAFGIAPALFAMRLDLNDTLRSGARGTAGGRGHQRFRQAVIVGQFAVAMVLLAGAGLFIRGLDDLNHRRAGWESARLVTGTYLLPSAGYATADDITAFHRRALERLESLPGVDSVSLAAFAPYFNWADSRKFVVEGRERPESGHEPAALVNAVTPSYFETFGTSVVAGRAFDERDSKDAPRVFLIDQTMARSLFDEENPVGRRVAQVTGASPQWGEIVGVVVDVQSSVAESSPVTFHVYVPMAQDPRRENELAVRVSGVAPAALVDIIRATMTKLDPDLPVRNLQPADATILRANYELAVFRDMLTAFAVLGLGLASLGIYGVIARTMAQRTGEFAIRLALGARVRDITRLVLASGVTQALTGSALGLGGAVAVSRLIAAAFPHIRTDRPGIFVATTLVLVAVALLACWLPARRAGKIDAMLALRAE